MRFDQLILKNVLRRRYRSLLTLLAIATAIASVVALRGISHGFVQAFQQVYRAHAVDVVVTRAGAADRLSSSVDEAIVGKIQELPNVERTAAVLLDTLSIEQRGVFGVPSMGLKAESWMFDDFKIEPSSQKFQADDAPQAMLGIHLAERLNAKIGDKLVILDVPIEIVGVFESTSVWENGSIILPIGLLQELTDRNGQCTYINVSLMQVSVSKTTLAEIRAVDPKLYPLLTEEFVQTDTRMALVRAMASLTSLIAMIIGTIGVLNSMLTSVYERTQEIGILRAVGWTKNRVVSMILLESAAVAIVASILGVIAAAGFLWLASYSPAARSLIPTRLDPLVMMEGVLLAIVMGLLGAWLPAWRAASLLPTDAFRNR